MKTISLSLLALAAGAAFVPHSHAQSVLPLTEAINQALQNSPEAEAAALIKQQAQSRILDAGARPNPEFGIELENFAGSSPNKGTDSAEFTYSLSQTLELGGKRGKRMSVAQTAARASELEAEDRLRQLAYSVRLAYLDGIAAEKRLTLATEQAELATRLRTAVKKRIDAGRDPNTNLINTETTLQQAQFERDTARVDIQRAHRTLASLLGDSELRYTLDTTALDTLPEAPLLSAEALQRSPQAQLAQLGVLHAEQSLQLAKTNARPDPTVNVGFRQFRENSSEAFLLGVSIPIPVFDSNKGSIAGARAELGNAQVQARRTHIELANHVDILQTQAASLRTQIEHLQNNVMPLAEQSESALNKHYNEGRLTLLDVISAQANLKQAQQQLLDMQLRYHRTVAELERLQPSQFSVKE